MPGWWERFALSVKIVTPANSGLYYLLYTSSWGAHPMRKGPDIQCSPLRNLWQIPIFEACVKDVWSEDLLLTQHLKDSDWSRCLHGSLSEGAPRKQTVQGERVIPLPLTFQLNLKNKGTFLRKRGWSWHLVFGNWGLRLGSWSYALTAKLVFHMSGRGKGTVACPERNLLKGS